MGILDRYRELSPPDSELGSVVNNLHHILNTKAGYYPIMREFGLSDLSMASERTAALRLVAQDILRNIRQYEPRLQVESLSTQGRGADFLMRIEVRGRLRGRPQRLLILFHQIYGGCEVRSLHVD
jgi:predicted component of type VI protein secretion system